MKWCFLTCDDKKLGAPDDLVAKEYLEKTGDQVFFHSWTDGGTGSEKCDAYVFRSTWDYYKHLPQFRQWLSQTRHQKNIFHHSDLIQWNLDKMYLKELEDKSISIVPTIFLKKDEQITLSTVDNHEYWILKPSISASAYQTLKFHKSEIEIANQKHREIIASSHALLQPYIQSVESQGEVSLIYFNLKSGAEFSHAVLKKAKPGDFRVQSEHGGSVEIFLPQKIHFELAEKLLKNLPHPWQYARIDLVHWQQNPQLIEIELIEPELFFRFAPDRAPELFRQAISDAL